MSRKSPDGISTTDVVLSAAVSSNAPVFKDVLKLHVREGSTVADITYGAGAFWRLIPDGLYNVLATDDEIDWHGRIPYDDESVDAVVLDPPYMEGLYRSSVNQMAGSGTHSPFRERYSNGEQVTGDRPKYHAAVLDSYLSSGPEVKRVLKKFGIFIVKCQDEVSANRQHLTHVELINAWAGDFYCKDLFVVVRPNRPGVSRLLEQEHARKNHSYFLVFVKRDPDHPSRIRPPKSGGGRNGT